MIKRRSLAPLALLVALLPTSVAASSHPAPPAPDRNAATMWPAPSDVPGHVDAAGLEWLELKKGQEPEMHIHPVLTVLVKGRKVTVPAEVGIHRPRGGKPSFSQLHTHDTSGKLHVEAVEWKEFTLGQFFTEWGVDIDRAPVTAYLDGQRLAGDPAAVVLRDRQRITLRYAY